MTRSRGAKRIVRIVQPSIPRYRAPFYHRLHEMLGSEGIDLDIIAGIPTRERAARGDQVDLKFSHRVRTARVRLGGINFTMKPSALLARADLTVVEHASTVLENYPLLAGTRRTAVWGHGAPFVSSGSGVDLKLERWQARRASHVFTYTADGRDFLIRNGIDPTKITVVANSTDTATLARARDLSAETPDRFAQKYGSAGRRAILYMGGLDGSKRIDLLINSIKRISSNHPDVLLYVAGDGVDTPIVKQAEAAGDPVRHLGHLSTQSLAEVASICELMAIPGRVGLAATDSFALGLPIFTTEYPHHAPEFSYLRPGIDCSVSAYDEESYSDSISQALFGSRIDLDSLRTATLSRRGDFSVENMAARYFGGLMRALESSD